MVKPDPHEEAERIVVEEGCKEKPNPEVIRKFSHVGYDTDDGLVCAARIIDALSIEKVLGEPGLLTASDTLWRIVDRGILNKRRRHAIGDILNRVRITLDHPLRSEAWLGLRLLEREEGNIQRIGIVPYMPVPATHVAALTGNDATSLKDRFERAHSLQREALTWLISERGRSRLSANPTSANPELSRMAALADVIRGYSLMRKDFLEAFVSQFFTEGYLTLVPVSSDPSPSGTDSFPPVHFKLAGKICSDGGRCAPIESELHEATNVPYIMTTPMNDTLSQAQVYLHYLRTTPVPGTIASYTGFIASYIGGGQKVDRTVIGSIPVNPESGTATVTYSLKGEIIIPSCTDPLICSVRVRLITIGTPSTVLGKTSMSFVLNGPAGEENIAVTAPEYSSRIIDRSLGQHSLKVTLSRSDSHTGSCCTGWRQQAFGIFIDTLDSGNPVVLPKVVLPAIPAWTDQRMIDGLKGFEVLRQKIHEGMAMLPARSTIQFGNILAPKEITHDMRFIDVWARTLYARLSLSWSNDKLQPGEANELAALRTGVSSRARERLLSPLSAELQAWIFAHGALDPTPIRLVMAALVKNTELTQPLDEAEVKIAAAQGIPSESETGKTLAKAKTALEVIRAGQPRVDALLLLMSLEEDFLRKGREAQRRIDQLSQELTQLTNGS